LWPHDGVVQFVRHSQLQIVSATTSFPQCNPEEFEFELPSHLQPSDNDLQELSYEEGIHLIDEMYGTKQPDHDIEDMDINDGYAYYVLAETHYDLEQMHSESNEVKELMHSNDEHDIPSTFIHTLQEYRPTPTNDNNAAQIHIYKNILEAEELLYRAQEKFYRFRRSWPVMRSGSQLCLEINSILMRDSIDVDIRL
jgi:hypothetical protein